LELDMTEERALLVVEHLSVTFGSESGSIRAVDDVSFSVQRNRTLGIVGESGSGKTTVLMAAMGLLSSPGVRVEGSIRLEGVELVGLADEEFREIRGRDVAMVFQDPMSSLHPLHTVGWQVAEAIKSHEAVRKEEATERAIDALREVGLPSPAQRSRQYPHELSGGMRQRVMIAMALVLRPKLVLADEPTTALDVTVQAQILELLEQVREQIGAAVILVTHDLAVIAERSEETIVMYGGRIMEAGPTAELFREPSHPYTKALLNAVPRHDAPRLEELPHIKGSPPSPSRLPKGCPFHPRCPSAFDECAHERPALLPFAPRRSAACLLVSGREFHRMENVPNGN
jgi:peptide/nickel transport system ATP-binding protein